MNLVENPDVPREPARCGACGYAKPPERADAAWRASGGSDLRNLALTIENAEVAFV